MLPWSKRPQLKTGGRLRGGLSAAVRSLVKRVWGVNVNQNVSRTQVNLAKIANSPELLEKANELSRELNKLCEEDKD
jgi:hypothetical protein